MPRILIVEDSPAQARQLAQVLEEAGFTVATAGDAESAWERLGHEPFDLVLSDLVMPGASGFELCRWIKQDARLRVVPVVVLTSQADPVHVLRGLEAGADGFMTKDRPQAEVVARVQRTLGAGPASTEEPAAPVKARFLNHELTLTAGRERLLNVLLSAFEDVIDLNERNSEEIQRRRKVEGELVKAREAAEAANRAKSAFLASMSHEVRTPLNGIIGTTELALGTRLTPEQREYLQMVKTSADALLSVINDILDFSKIEAGKLELEAIEYDLRDCVGDALKALGLRAFTKGLELACDVRPDVPEIVVGDPGRLRQVVFNLVGNAIKFTERGEVVVRVSVESRGSDRALLHVAVQDTGIGIPRDKQSAIFEAFSQGETSTSRKYGGTGLGLTISRRLVEMQGGHLWVESESGKGSTFHFTFTVAVPRSSVLRAQGVLRLPPARWRGMPVLVVDDHPTNRRILEEVLANWGMLPATAEGGTAALKELERGVATGRPFLLVLLDLQMPQMDGFLLAGEVRRRPALAGTVLVLLSSCIEPGHSDRCRELGIRGMLLKPFKQAELLALLQSALEDSHASGPASTQAQQPVARRPLRVLLAEDNQVNQVLVERLMAREGHRVVIVGSGKEVVEQLEREAFDLALMDVEMPVMDGIEATAAIRAREQGSGRRMPIVAMTAHALKGDRQRLLAAGMDGYVSKPIQPRELWAAIDAVLGLAPQRVDRPASAALPAVVDLESALDRVAGDRELLIELARVFLDDCPRMEAAVRDAVAARDLRQLQIAAHSLRGSLGNFAAQAAVPAMGRLEALARQGALGGASDAAALALTEVSHVKEALRCFAK